jgi:hypothetical protein
MGRVVSLCDLCVHRKVFLGLFLPPHCDRFRCTLEQSSLSHSLPSAHTEFFTSARLQQGTSSRNGGPQTPFHPQYRDANNKRAAAPAPTTTRVNKDGLGSVSGGGTTCLGALCRKSSSARGEENERGSAAPKSCRCAVASAVNATLHWVPAAATTCRGPGSGKGAVTGGLALVAGKACKRRLPSSSFLGEVGGVGVATGYARTRRTAVQTPSAQASQSSVMWGLSLPGVAGGRSPSSYRLSFCHMNLGLHHKPRWALHSCKKNLAGRRGRTSSTHDRTWACADTQTQPLAHSNAPKLFLPQNLFARTQAPGVSTGSSRSPTVKDACSCAARPPGNGPGIECRERTLGELRDPARLRRRVAQQLF